MTPTGDSVKPPGNIPTRATKTSPTAAESGQPHSFLYLYRPDIWEALAVLDAPRYRHAQVYEHLTRRPLKPFAQATTLPTDLRLTLDELGTSTLALADLVTSSDATTKLLLSTRDGLLIESVIMRYRERTTVCISSQVGCPVGCSFCATGAIGFRRNLSVSEIVDQVLRAASYVGKEGRRISNVVYMGMGEPMLNLDPVLGSIKVLTDPRGLGMSHRALSVSTIGIPRGIVRMARVEPQVNLAISLHAVDDRTRELLIPKACRHPLSDILKAAWEHFEITRRKLLIEYVMLDGINDSPDDARRLAALLRGHVVAVNLLAWNAPVASAGSARQGAQIVGKLRVGETMSLRSSTPTTIAAFRKTLLDVGIEAVVRQSKGGGIQAACGQLAGTPHSNSLLRSGPAEAPSKAAAHRRRHQRLG